MNDEKTRTITLTDRPPVKIREDEWPLIAHGRYSDHDGEIESQANRTWRCDIRVRQHEDGRAIAYGVYDYDSNWRGERGVCVKAGALLEAGADHVDGIRTVGATLMSETGGQYDGHIAEAVRECIADLPAVTL